MSRHRLNECPSPRPWLRSRLPFSLGRKAVASPEGVEGYLQRRLSLVSVAVLAGGQSKRMGQDKAFLQVGQSSVIERVLDSVTGLTDDLFRAYG
jgi:hypothetical protein